MKYFSTIKINGVLIDVIIRTDFENCYAKLNIADIKGQRACDFTYIKYIEQTNKKVDFMLLDIRGIQGRELLLNCLVF